MQQIMVSLSALRVSQFRKFVKGWDKGRYAAVFEKYGDADRKAYRIYLPLNRPKEQPLPAPADISEAVQSLGYQVEDYRAGIAVDSSGKRRLRIGRLLGKHKELQKRFNEDKTRAAQAKYVVCISRHPYDIAGSSTDRGWTSCMNLVDGTYKDYVFNDVKLSGLVAYLINEKDRNIANPTARVLIKPFYPSSGDPVFVADSVYGTEVHGFKATVQAWLDSNLNHGKKAGAYKISADSYNDGKDIHLHLDKDDPKSIQKVLGFRSDPDGNWMIKTRFDERRELLSDSPELLFKMTRVLKYDVMSVAHVEPKMALSFVEKHLNKIYETTRNEKISDSGRQDMIHHILMRDVSLFERVSKLITVNDSLLDEMFRTNAAKAVEYVPRKLISQKLFDGLMTNIDHRSRKVLVGAFPELLPDNTLDTIRKFPRMFLTLEEPTVEQFDAAIATEDRDAKIAVMMTVVPKTVSKPLAHRMQQYALEEMDPNQALRFTHRLVTDIESPVYADPVVSANLFRFYEPLGSALFSLERQFATRVVFSHLTLKDKLYAIRKRLVRDVLVGIFSLDWYKLSEQEATAVMETYPSEFKPLPYTAAVKLFEISERGFELGFQHMLANNSDIDSASHSNDFYMTPSFWKRIADIDIDRAVVYLRALLKVSDNIAYDCSPMAFIEPAYHKMLMAYTERPWVLATEEYMVKNVGKLPRPLIEFYRKLDTSDYGTNRTFLINKMRKAVADYDAA